MEGSARGRRASWAISTMAGLVGLLAFGVGISLAVVVYFASPLASYVLVGTLFAVGVVAFALTDNPFVVALASGAALAGILGAFLLFFLSADTGSDVEDGRPVTPRGELPTVTPLA